MYVLFVSECISPGPLVAIVADEGRDIRLMVAKRREDIARKRPLGIHRKPKGIEICKR